MKLSRSVHFRWFGVVACLVMIAGCQMQLVAGAGAAASPAVQAPQGGGDRIKIEAPMVWGGGSALFHCHGLPPRAD